jgi:hypothetical protein
MTWRTNTEDKWPPPLTLEAVNIIEETIHDLDPARVRARRSAVMARLQPLRICGGWEHAPGPRPLVYCGREFYIMTPDEHPFDTCPECRKQEVRRRRQARRMAA